MEREEKKSIFEPLETFQERFLKHQEKTNLQDKARSIAAKMNKDDKLDNFFTYVFPSS